MTPFDVLNTIRQAGGRVIVLDGDLLVEAPPGTLTQEAAVVLREHKAALVPILPDAEREAIQWVEGLPSAAAEIVVETARREWEEVVGTVEEPVVVRVEQIGDELVLTAPTQAIADKIEEGRQRIEQVLAEIKPPDTDHDLNAWAAAQLGQVSCSAPTLPEQQAEEVADPPTPCQQCGSLELWQDCGGRWRCTVCEAAGLQRSQRLVEQAARLRAGRRLKFKVGGKAAPTPVPWPPAHLQLPSTVEAIEQGRPAPARQQNLLDDRHKQIERLTPDQTTRSRSFVPAGGW